MQEVIQVLADLSTLVFVVSSMLSLGLSLTLQQILNPLRNPGFLGRVLLANFVLVPLVAYLLKTVIPLDPSLAIGLSVELYFGPIAPTGKEKNWIPTVPGRGWFAYFRFYAPTEPYFDRTWSLPDIARAQ